AGRAETAPSAGSSASRISGSSRVRSSRCLGCCALLYDRPANAEERLGARTLREPLLELVDELVALLHDLILDLEDVLALAALLALEFLHLLLDLVLLFQRRGLPRLPTQCLDLLLGVRQCLFGREHHVVGPALQLLARLVEMLAVLLQRPAHSGLRVTLRFGG